MAISPQEVEMLFSSAAMGYIFKYCFEERNPGMQFDKEAFTEKITELANDPFLSMDKDKQKEFDNALGDLDRYAMPIEFDKSKLTDKNGKPKITLV